MITSGLYEDNLRALLPLVERLFFQRPVLYGSIRVIVVDLLGEWENGVMATDRLNAIERSLADPLIAALDAEFQSATVLLEKLNDLHRAWKAL